MSSSADDFMGMAAAAVTLRALYDAYVAAGFTDRQAMQIVLKLVEVINGPAVKS